ncbi:transcriptional regulator, MerR family [Acidovorax delafieldii 2AN]|uniref:Transcriptional regulator, MerR family n=1 Tax=Acidovorax delafieldii 2AN TaxID=573060 RepID=C5SZT9_ACIDE|nr:MerR family transcriptional regulator [Acidovorax delafieldii]EER62255.1 transcriptional regulator, MerR family [Acidovorax delafieldii 2AN]
MSAGLSGDTAAGLPITAVERETGLSKDTLRVWEKRYGFPRPLRDTRGDRRYPAAQVQQLQLISRLLDAGHRPGKIVGLEPDALQALMVQREPSPTAFLSTTKVEEPGHRPELAAMLDSIGAHDPQALRHALSHAQLRMGLASFVTEVVAPLTTAVGDAWARGRFEVFEEHLFTEVITGVLRTAIGSLAPLPVPLGPKVLLTTLPQEVHGLGLLMVEALLALEGCTCVSLGTQTPSGNVVQAAQAHRADVVVLSFSNVHNGAVVQASLRELRSRLPAETALWVGGSCTALYQRPLDGVTAVPHHLSGLQSQVALWRRTH